MLVGPPPTGRQWQSHQNTALQADRRITMQAVGPLILGAGDLPPLTGSADTVRAAVKIVILNGGGGCSGTAVRSQCAFSECLFMAVLPP